MYVCVCICMYMCEYAYVLITQLTWPELEVCVSHTYMHTYIHTCMHIYKYTYTYTYTYIHTKSVYKTHCVFFKMVYIFRG